MSNRSDELTERNRAALKLLHDAAAAISDGELDYARRLQRHAARRLSPGWDWRLAAYERLIITLTPPPP
jgi:hypothetical protein